VNEDALVMWVDDVNGAEYQKRLRGLAEQLPDGVRP